MIGNLDHATLQHLWWLIVSVVGALFVFLTFVQGGQTLLLTAAHDDVEKKLIVNSLGRKWELTFTTLVLFGGALFAAFPLFYATSFGGAYWVWMLILATFVLQAVSYEFRTKPGNLLGARTYEAFMFINGSVGLLLVGAALGTFFTGASFTLDDYNRVTWLHSLRGLEAAFSLFNLSMGLFLVFLARVLGALYLCNHIRHEDLHERLRRAVVINMAIALPFLLYVLVRLATMDGFAVDAASGQVSVESFKYLKNLLAMPVVLIMLVAGLLLVIAGVVMTGKGRSTRGIWPAGIGTVLTALSLLLTAGFHGSAFYPSAVDPASSLTIFNASSSHFTLTAMSYVALAVPFVLAYIACVWRMMDRRKFTTDDLESENAKNLY